MLRKNDAASLGFPLLRHHDLFFSTNEASPSFRGPAGRRLGMNAGNVGKEDFSVEPRV